jgi:hypothetical protein
MIVLAKKADFVVKSKTWKIHSDYTKLLKAIQAKTL